MKLEQFDYTLPESLIARFPTKERTASRLMVVDESGLKHQHFHDIVEHLRPGDLLVFNDTRVIPARLFGVKASGGRIEVLVERITATNEVLAHVRASKSPKPGSRLLLEDQADVEVIGRDGEFFRLRFLNGNALETIEALGHMPLPPYIERPDEASDMERYQTVYAKHKGSVAAPTAGLHFDESLLKKLMDKGVDTAYVTLHVGAGTFQPVRVENIKDHQIHAEWLQVPENVCEQVRQTKANGGRVIAVGTTAVRSLETASQTGAIQAFEGETRLYIYPGYQFHCVDAMVTNFHLPKSSLLMLISAFVGHERIMQAYQTAIEQQYRFYSYGDAMFLSSRVG